MSQYDLDLVKQAAVGRWAEILSSFAGVDPSVLDGSHHPCPKCSSDPTDDRFRALNDFNETGAVLCGKCFPSKNGDGFAAVGWLKDWDFKTSLQRVATHVGVAPKKRKKADPTQYLEFLPWNRVTPGLWCKKKNPIRVDALEKLGAKYARYRNDFSVIAIPVWGPQLDAEEAVGWIIYRSDGGTLPRYKKNAPVEWAKVLLTPGSSQGIVASLDDWKRMADGYKGTWWKLEGSTDLLAAMSVQGWPANTSFFTTANGAKEKPLDWIVEALKGQKVFVCHDADKPGQDGATWVEQVNSRKRAGWCPALMESADDVRNVCLPFTVEPTAGPDIRDYFNGGGSVQTLIEMAQAAKIWKPEIDAIREDEEYVPRDIDNAYQLAVLNLEHYRREHTRNLVFWRNEWYRYKGTHYERIDSEHLRVRVRQFVQNYFERCWKAGEDPGRDSVRNVTKAMVDNVIEDMKGICLVSPSVELDTWMEGGASDCVALENKVLSVSELFAGKSEDEYLFDHSPKWFSLTCLPYEFDPHAKCKTWQDFLIDVLEHPEQIDVLQRWFGYLLLPDTSLEKMLFVIGPTRSGKGTIMKVMHRLFGSNQVATPTLNGLLEQYALHGLTGKTIAIIPDARLSRRMDREAIAERLLSLVANDPQDVQRKYLNSLAGVRMNLRFTLFSNKLPELDDSSAAMVGRGIYLQMRKSYLGRENLGLQEMLMQELPGILNWAIAGRHALQQERMIKQPEFSAHMVRHMRMSMAPVSQFFEERCVIDYDSSVPASDLFEAWCNWASENAYVTKMNQTDFERRSIDANPAIQTRIAEMGGMDIRSIVGVRLKREEHYVSN